MLKLIIFCLTLWHGIHEISCVDENRSATATRQSSHDDKKNFTVNFARHYNIHTGNIIFNVNGRSFHPIDIGKSINIERKIDANYIETIGMGAHKLHRRKLPWSKARKMCNDEQGHLAVIRSDAEERIILRMIQEMSVDDVWLGVHDQFEEGEWVTVMDEPLGEAGWATWSKNFPINPDNSGGHQNCARLDRNGGMDDENCNNPRSFICKISNI